MASYGTALLWIGVGILAGLYTRSPDEMRIAAIITVCVGIVLAVAGRVLQ